MKLVPILFFLSINVNVNVIASDVAPVDIKDFATQSLNNIPMNNKDFSGRAKVTLMNQNVNL
jgi:hypothetical protein